jgi:hypothetical protein
MRLVSSPGWVMAVETWAFESRRRCSGENSYWVVDRLRLSACCGLRRAQAQAVLRRILYWMTILRDFPEMYLGYTSHNTNVFI